MILSQVNKILFRQNLAIQFVRYTHNDYSMKVLYPLKSRKLLEVSGKDSEEFLQGLITNDMRHLQEGAKSMYAMFLNSKGRVLYDTLIYKWANENVYMLECDKSVVSLLQKHLKLYKLRRKVDIQDMSPHYNIWALILPPDVRIYPEADILRNITFYPDPRLPDLGLRIISSINVDLFDLTAMIGKDTVIESNEDGYKLLRYSLGVSEGSEDMFPGACLPLEANCDYLHGVSFHKGCYIGQELTARVHHTGVVRKRIMPIKFHQARVEDLVKDAPIMSSSEQKSVIGKLKSGLNGYGLGLVRIKEALQAKTPIVGKYPIEVIKPSWWPIEAAKEKITASKVQEPVVEV